MPNQFINPQPNYSGVTIQINNPAVNVANPNYPNSSFSDGAIINSGSYATYPQACTYPNVYYPSQPKNPEYTNPNAMITDSNRVRNDFYANNTKDLKTEDRDYKYSYPSEYYLNNYSKNAQDRINSKNNQKEIGVNDYLNNDDLKQSTNKFDNSDSIANYESKDTYKHNNKIANESNEENIKDNSHVAYNYDPSAYRVYGETSSKEVDTSTSKGIIDELNSREEAIQEEKKNSKETRIVALTDEYIKSLENYLDNPNDEIRLMASKEILTRLDEDKDRYDDAALNALLNKMLQDPSKLIRIAALSAFASQLASGNDYTVKLLNDIQSNPNADKEDVLQAADILLKMSAGTEIKNIPNQKQQEEPSQTN